MRSFTKAMLLALMTLAPSAWASTTPVPLDTSKVKLIRTADGDCVYLDQHDIMSFKSCSELDADEGDWIITYFDNNGQQTNDRGAHFTLYNLSKGYVVPQNFWYSRHYPQNGTEPAKFKNIKSYFTELSVFILGETGFGIGRGKYYNDLGIVQGAHVNELKTLYIIDKDAVQTPPFRIVTRNYGQCLRLVSRFIKVGSSSTDCDIKRPQNQWYFVNRQSSNTFQLLNGTGRYIYVSTEERNYGGLTVLPNNLPEEAATYFEYDANHKIFIDRDNLSGRVFDVWGAKGYSATDVGLWRKKVGVDSWNQKFIIQPASEAPLQYIRTNAAKSQRECVYKRIHQSIDDTRNKFSKFGFCDPVYDTNSLWRLVPSSYKYKLQSVKDNRYIGKQSDLNDGNTTLYATGNVDEAAEFFIDGKYLRAYYNDGRTSRLGTLELERDFYNRANWVIKSSQPGSNDNQAWIENSTNSPDSLTETKEYVLTNQYLHDKKLWGQNFYDCFYVNSDGSMSSGQGSCGYSGNALYKMLVLPDGQGFFIKSVATGKLLTQYYGAYEYRFDYKDINLATRFQFVMNDSINKKFPSIVLYNGSSYKPYNKWSVRYLVGVFSANNYLTTFAGRGDGIFGQKHFPGSNVLHFKDDYWEADNGDQKVYPGVSYE